MIRSAISQYYHRCGYPLPLQRSHQLSVRATTARTFSSTTSWKQPPPPPTQHQQPPDHNSATIIQGPSLLTSTGVHRPSPSLFHLPGLRSLPLWTAPPEVQQQQQEGRRTRIAYNDPIVTAAVQHVESNYASIRSEYFSAVLGQGTDIVASLFRNHNNNGGSGSTILSNNKPLEPDYDVSTRGGEHAEDALHSGTWDWHSYILNGMRNERFREKCPKTAQVVDDVRVGVICFFFICIVSFSCYCISTLYSRSTLFCAMMMMCVSKLDKENMLFGTPFAFSFFSTLHGNSSIKAHSGPMNLRLRMHLPLIVPSKNPHDDLTSTTVPPSGRGGDGSSASRHPRTGIQVADQVREWHEGSAIVLDDSYVHEVWNNTDQSRVLFLLDIWHPDVRMDEREKITNMFDYARGKGWIGRSEK
jgi:hypothetical protein